VSSRRSFLITMVGSGVLLGFARSGIAAIVLPPAGHNDDQTAAAALVEPTIWYGIGRDGAVTVNIIRAEMGQHVGTALARIVADELEADWSKVRIVHVDSDPKWGEMVTGGSWSVWQSFPVLSRAGAAGRIALTEVAAKLLRVPPQACTARYGIVSSGSRAITYGEIVTRGDLRRSFTPDELQAIPIKPPDERRLIGHDTMAVDVPVKTTGEARYGLDAAVDGMIYARPKIPPTRNDSQVVAIDDAEAKSVPGYIQSLALDDPSGTAPGWVIIYADSFVAADSAADLVKVTWHSGEAATVSEQDLQRRAAELIADPEAGALVVEDPGVDAAFATAKSTVERVYTTSSVMHFQLEPVNALAFEKDACSRSTPVINGNH
jgi:CO/xanthine dehydrogenase Mo-binding subunit